MSDAWQAPTHQVAGAVGGPGCRAWGQQGAAPCEAAGGGAAQHPEGGVHHALAGVGGSVQAQLRPEGEGEEPPPGAEGTVGALQGGLPSLSSRTQVSGATSNWGTAGDRGQLTHPNLAFVWGGARSCSLW